MTRFSSEESVVMLSDNVWERKSGLITCREGGVSHGEHLAVSSDGRKGNGEEETPRL